MTHRAELDHLPDGTFVRIAGVPHLVTGSTLRPWTFHGYGPPLRRPSGPIEILTPAPTVAVLRHGYRPALHASAG